MRHYVTPFHLLSIARREPQGRRDTTEASFKLEYEAQVIVGAGIAIVYPDLLVHFDVFDGTKNNFARRESFFERSVRAGRVVEESAKAKGESRQRIVLSPTEDVTGHYSLRNLFPIFLADDDDGACFNHGPCLNRRPSKNASSALTDFFAVNEGGRVGFHNSLRRG